MSNSSIDLSRAALLLGLRGGPYAFYVQAVGQPSIVNHRAGPTTKTFTAK